MVTVEEARRWVLDKSFPLEEEWLPVEFAVGRVLAQDVLAITDLPAFRNSAVDGYVFLRNDLDNGMRKFKIAGEIQAGKSTGILIDKEQCYRIFTGAVIPENADIVIMQEATDRGAEIVEVKDYQKNQKTNIRETGEQIRKGQIALAQGHQLNPASIGFLVSFGIHEVPLIRLPRIAILTTGNELKKPGDQLETGEIFESNSFSLKAALMQNGFNRYIERYVSDDLVQTRKAIGDLLAESEVLIVSGGISVGKYDFVREGLEYNDVDEVFYKVNQKPGKPMFFGVKSEKLVFALPGNPASLLVCFYEYVLPSLNKLMGKNPLIHCQIKTLINDLEFSGTRPEFFRAIFRSDDVEVLTGQNSAMLKSFAESNCLVYIHGEKRKLIKGEKVEVHPIF